MGLVGAIGRFFRAIGHLFTGKVNKKTENIMKDPNAMRGAWDEVISQERRRAGEYMDAVAEMQAQNQKRIRQLEQKTEKASRLEDVIKGAKAKAAQRAKQLQNEGKTQDEIVHDEEFLKLQSVYADASSTLSEINESITDLEGEIKVSSAKIRQHEASLKDISRNIEKLKTEKHDSVADVQAAEHERRINDALNNIQKDGSEETLSQLRDIRSKAKARADVSANVSGAATMALESELASFGASSQASSDFISDIFGNNQDEDTKKVSTNAGSNEPVIDVPSRDSVSVGSDSGSESITD